jgi:hypothetical protein
MSAAGESRLCIVSWADLDAGQQTGERRSLYCGADRIGNGRGIATSAMTLPVSYLGAYETERDRLGPGDCTRSRRVRGGQRSRPDAPNRAIDEGIERPCVL